MGWLVPFKKGKEAGNANRGPHKVIHVGGVHNYVGPMKAVIYYKLVRIL